MVEVTAAQHPTVSQSNNIYTAKKNKNRWIIAHILATSLRRRGYSLGSQQASQLHSHHRTATINSDLYRRIPEMDDVTELWAFLSLSFLVVSTVSTPEVLWQLYPVVFWSAQFAVQPLYSIHPLGLSISGKHIWTRIAVWKIIIKVPPMWENRSRIILLTYTTYTQILLLDGDVLHLHSTAGGVLQVVQYLLVGKTVIIE